MKVSREFIQLIFGMILSFVGFCIMAKLKMATDITFQVFVGTEMTLALGYRVSGMVKSIKKTNGHS